MKFKVYGIEGISTRVQGIKLDVILHLFRNLKEKETQRPSGKMKALIGFEYAGYQLVQQQSEEHLLVLKNFYGIEAMGAECNPKRGNCKCGRCPLGRKYFLLKEEGKYNLFKKKLE